MTQDHKAAVDIATLLRPIRGCATDEQYQDVWSRVETALLAAQTERDEVIEECAKVVQSAREGEMDTDFRSIIYAIRALKGTGT